MSRKKRILLMSGVYGDRGSTTTETNIARLEVGYQSSDSAVVDTTSSSSGP